MGSDCAHLPKRFVLLTRHVFPHATVVVAVSRDRSGLQGPPWALCLSGSMATFGAACRVFPLARGVDRTGRATRPSPSGCESLTFFRKGEGPGYHHYPRCVWERDVDSAQIFCGTESSRRTSRASSTGKAQENCAEPSYWLLIRARKKSLNLLKNQTAFKIIWWYAVLPEKIS